MPTLVQKAISPDANGSVTSLTLNISAGGAGNTHEGMVTFANAATLTSVKDNNGVTYNIVDTINDITNGQVAASFYLPNIPGGSTSLVATFSGATTFTRMEMQEWSGEDTAPLDGHVAATSTGTTITTGNYTTTADGDQLYCGAVCDTAGNQTLAAAGGYTIQNQGTGGAVTNDMADESLIQTTHSTTTTGSFTTSSSQTYLIFGMAFKAAAVSSAVPILSRPIRFRPFTLAPFLNRLPPTTSPSPNIPPGVVVRVSGPVRFKPFAKAPFLNKLEPISPAFNSGNVTSLPGFGSLTLSGLPPSLAERVFPGFGSITLNGQAPSLRAMVAPGFGSLVLTGRAPNLAFVDHPGFGSIILTGFAPTANITSGQTALPGIGQVILTGLAPSLAEKVFPANGAILLTGKAPTLKATVPAGFGSIVLTGKTPFIAALPGIGAVLLTGKAPTVSQSGGGAAVFQAITSLPGFFNPNASAIP